MASASAEELIERIREAALARGASGIKGLGRMFRLFDDNGCKKLDFREFKTGLQDYGCKVTDAECRKLFDCFDMDDNGTINFDEFIQVIRPPISKTRKNLIEQAFNKMDANGSGELTVEDLRGVYDPRQHAKYRSGEWNAKQVFREFLDNFQAGSSGTSQFDEKVTMDEWMNYYCGVSASIDQDIYFDYMMRQAWKL